MSDIISLSELLSQPVKRQIEKTVEIEQLGKSVTIKSLKGYDATKACSLSGPEQILYFLVNGVVEPKMKERQALDLIDSNPKIAKAIADPVADLTMEWLKAEKEEAEEAEKN